MPNNRLKLRCAICYGQVAIARVNDGDSGWTPIRADGIPAYAQFLIEHQTCDPEGRLHLKLVSENDHLLVLNEAGWVEAEGPQDG